MVVSLLIVTFLILVNMLYVAAEFSAVSVRRGRIRVLAEERHRLAARLLPHLENPQALDRYVAACQIGITLSSLILGAYAQAFLAVRLAPLFATWALLGPAAAQSSAVIVVLIILTALQVLFGELVPKSAALQNPTTTALYTILPMQWSLRAFAWLIALLNGGGLVLLKLFGVPNAGHRHVHSPEEIELLIVESRDGGLLEPEEHRRLHRALQLHRRMARQLMVPRPRVQSVDIATPPLELLTIVANSPFTRLPVYRDVLDNVVGVLYTKDVVLKYLDRGGDFRLEEIMRPSVMVHENIPADRLLSLLRERRSHQAFVIDEYGGVSGLVTLEDVLAELLGGVADEFKELKRDSQRLPDGRVRLPGSLRLDEAAALVGVAWRGRSDTVGGHITDVLGRLPARGERLMIEGVEIEVEDVAARVIVSVLARPTARPTATPPESQRPDAHG